MSVPEDPRLLLNDDDAGSFPFKRLRDPAQGSLKEMREGLRSTSNLSAKTEKNEVTVGQSVAEKEANVNKQKECGSSDEENSELVSSGAMDEELVSVSNEEMQVGKGDGMKCKECIVGSDDLERQEDNADGRKRIGMDGEGGNEDGGVEKVVAKEEVADGKVRVFSRVLRSRIVIKSEGGRGCEGRKSGNAIGGSDESAKKRVEVEDRKGEYVNVQDGGIAGDGFRQALKRKRGRPPKVRQSDDCGEDKLEGEDDADVEGEDQYNTSSKVVKKFKGKRGRLSKARNSGEVDNSRIVVEVEDVLSVEETNHNIDGKVKEKFKRKRGRPPKAQKSVDFDGNWVEVRSAGKENKEAHGKVNAKCGRPPNVKEDQVVGRPKRKATHNASYCSSLCGKTFNEKESKAKKLAPRKKIKCTANNGEEPDIEEPGEKSQSERQVVREKIIKLLLDAGWTIEYRPRHGKDYNDSVYVNPEGRTCWSVTLAYRQLKKHYDDGGANAGTCKAGFKFSPIPDEEINVLTRVTVKERCDKNKKKKWKRYKQGLGKKLAGVGTKKKRKQEQSKRKLENHASPKALRGRTRPKTSLMKQIDLVNQLDTTTASAGNHRKRCALMVRKSMVGTESDGDGYVLYNGKRSVLAWMIDLGTVLENGKVWYLKHRKARTVFEGTLTADGIQCNCCAKTFSVSEFELHAGGKSRQPSANIYLERGTSLLQCQLDSWNKQDEHIRKGFHFVDISGEDRNDDTCGICGDGGNLICCDGCPSTFHQSCLDIKNFPSGVWHCLYCSCKFCGMVDGVASQMGDDDYVAPMLLTCHSCQEKYHESCAQIGDATTDNPRRLSFCGKKCHELHKRLQNILGVKHELQDGFSWTLLCRCDVGFDISVSGMPQKVECNSKVAVALHVMDECFLPMSDHRSGVNLIRNIVYNFGSNLNRLNYSGFLTAILEKGDEIVAAASIRIHGNHLAEMPFIGTRHVYRRQGMCRRLLSAIETGLSSLNVEKLVIPAISALRETWTSVFGFELVEGLSKQKMRRISMVVFPGVDMLQKPLLKHHLAEDNMVSVEGFNSSKLNEQQTRDEPLDECSSPVLMSCLDESAICEGPNVPLRPAEGLDSFKLKEQQTRNEIVDDSDHGCSHEYNLRGSERTGLHDACHVNGETAADKCAPLVLCRCLDETSTFAGPDVTVWLAMDNMASTEGFNSSELKEQQMKNKIVDDLNQRCSKYCNLRVSERAGLCDARNISGETATDECALPITDGTADEASVNTFADPNLPASPADAECPDASVEICDGRIKSEVNILHCLSCVDEQAGEISQHQNQSFGSAVLLCGEMMPDLDVQLNQDKLSQKVESKLSEISDVGFEESDCRREFLSASKEHVRTLHLGVEPCDNDTENKLNFLDERSMPVTCEFFNAQQEDISLEQEIPFSDAVLLQSRSRSCNQAQSIYQITDQSAQDPLNIHLSSLPIECDAATSALGGLVHQDGKISHAAASDLIMNSKSPSSTSNGPFESTEYASACEANVDCQCGKNEKPAAAQPDGLLDKSLIPDKSSKHPGFDSHVDLTTRTQSNSESLPNSSSTHGIPLHCASGGGNSCSAPDIMILSKSS